MRGQRDVSEREVLDVLRRARKLIGTPGSWCQGTTRKRAEDGTVVQRCLIGAVQDAVPEEDVEFPSLRTHATWPFEVAAYRFMEQMMGGKLVGYWNDRPDRTHDEVLALLDLTISRVEIRLGV